MKNKFFTNELVRFANIVLAPKFADASRKEITVKESRGQPINGAL